MEEFQQVLDGAGKFCWLARIYNIYTYIPPHPSGSHQGRTLNLKFRFYFASFFSSSIPDVLSLLGKKHHQLGKRYAFSPFLSSPLNYNFFFPTWYLAIFLPPPPGGVEKIYTPAWIPPLRKIMPLSRSNFLNHN